MTKKEKAFLRATVAFTILFATAPVANAMHIMEAVSYTHLTLPTKRIV